MYDRFDKKMERLFAELNLALATRQPAVIHVVVNEIGEAEELQLSEARKFARANLKGEGDSFIVAERKV